MSTHSSQPSDALACEALSDDDLQTVSGGVALVVGRVAAGVQVTTAKPITGVSLGAIRPINCNACVQGIPRDLVTNPVINQVVRVGF